MIKQKKAVLDHLIGNTPLVALPFEEEGVTILAKCEFLNPSGSIKDRLAKTIIEDAERRGLLRENSIILECSSGNTGVAFAMLGAAHGYEVVIVISERASAERLQLIRHFGGTVITFAESGYSAGIDLTRTMAAQDERYFLPRQFENPLNAADHEHATAIEIIGQVKSPVDAFVSGYGTGGTLAGVSRGLRIKYPGLQVFAMEPAKDSILNGEQPCRHVIEGVADGFVPDLLKGVQLEGTIKVTGTRALRMAKRLASEFGLLVGTSSGANIVAALEVANRIGFSKTIVTLLPDRAERYFSTGLFPPAV